MSWFANGKKTGFLPSQNSHKGGTCNPQAVLLCHLSSAAAAGAIGIDAVHATGLRQWRWMLQRKNTTVDAVHGNAAGPMRADGFLQGRSKGQNLQMQNPGTGGTGRLLNLKFFRTLRNGLIRGSGFKSHQFQRLM